MDTRVSQTVEERGRRPRVVRFLQARLSPEGYLGLHLTVGMLLIILTCWSFGEIAEDLSTRGWLASMDQHAADASQQVVTPDLTRLVKGVTFLGSVGFLTAVSASVALVLALQRARYRFSAFALTMAGGSVLNIALKHLFHRERPVLENPFVTLASFGFPSGHTMGTTLLCGSLAIIGATAVNGFGKRAGFFLLAAVWVMVIGASRIYLGAHYLTDVIGGFTAGVAWLAVCWTAVESLRRWRMRRYSFPRPACF